MEADFEDDFLEIWVGFQKVTNWKWKMELFSNGIRFNFENKWTRTITHLSFKLVPYKFVRKWRVLLKPAFAFISWLHKDGYQN